MAGTRKASEPSKARRPPATTPEARENQLVASAFDLAERQIAEGTASAQVITHFLKLGTEREKLERAKLNNENELLVAKRENIASGARVEELYEGAIKAMRAYSGQDDYDEYDD